MAHDERCCAVRRRCHNTMHKPTRRAQQQQAADENRNASEKPVNDEQIR
ncbi:MAG: hypothetical protein U0Z53_08285 [Blastocatellia bacterium]